MKRFLAVVLTFLVVTPAFAVEPKSRKEVDKSIERGLEYLRRTQETDGSWKGQGSKSAAVTSLAVMAFLAAGHVPGEGKYGDGVERGIQWVLKAQHVNGLIATQGQEMYHHGIATLMLAEAAGVTPGKLGTEVRKALEKAVVVILDAQRKNGEHVGGWRDARVGTDGDISVTGWQLMALRAAKNLGCDVPAESIERAIEYVKRCQEDRSGGFRYFPRGHLTVPCTGTSILVLELAGSKDDHHSPRVNKAGSYILSNPPQWGSPFFFYSIYYCSQATFQLGGNYWSFFRPQMQQVLLQHQRDLGCWDDPVSRDYGTAMAILALTVEYRLLPIYQRGDDSSESPK